MIRYIVCPGPMRSETDRDWHFVTGEQLARLYRLPPGTWETLEHPDHWTRYARIVDGRIESTVRMLAAQYRGEAYERIARELEEERARAFWAVEGATNDRCAVCGGRIEYLDPTGDGLAAWWAHDKHPVDHHDAVPSGGETNG